MKLSRGQRQLVAVLAATSTAMLAACTPGGGADETESSGDQLSIVLPVEPPTLDPCDAASSSTGVVVRSNITEPLIEMDPASGELGPRLATSWEQTTDTEWTFMLQEGVTFQDGTPFDATAAAASVDRIVNGDLLCTVEGEYWGDANVETEAVDDLTLKVTTEGADPLLPLRMSFVEMTSADTDPAEKVREVVGTGPYEIAEWKAGTSLELNRFDDYWGDAPEFASVQYQWRTEPSVRAATVSSGEADVALGLSPTSGAGDLGVDFLTNETVALRMSAELAPFDDIRIRQAVNYAIDRDGIMGSIFEGLGESATQLVPPSATGYDDDLEAWPYDPAKAEALVREAAADGVDVDVPITIVARNDQFPKVKELAEAIQGQLSDVGLKVEVKTANTTEHRQYQERPGVTDEGGIAVLLSHGNQAGDASFTTGTYMLTSGSNSFFGTKEFDKILQDAQSKSDDERQEAFAAAMDYEREKIVQFAYIANLKSVMALGDNLSYEPNAATNDEFRVSDVSMSS